MIENCFHDSQKYNTSFSVSVENSLNRGQSDIIIKNNPLLEGYHNNEQRLNKAIIYNMIAMLWTGMLLIAFSVVLAVLQGSNPNIIALASGTIVEMISGTLLILSKREMNSKDKFFDALSKSEEIRRLAPFIASIPDETIRAQCMKAYVEHVIK